MSWDIFVQASSWSLLVHWLLVLGIGLRVIMMRPATGVALAWLILVVTVPVGGALFYFLIGERRVGHRRASRLAELRSDFQAMAQKALEIDAMAGGARRLSSVKDPLGVLARKVSGSPIVTGNAFELISETDAILQRIAADVRQATTSVMMEFYIWNEGGVADEVLEALIEAAGRGVRCRVLIDAMGARPWWRGKQPVRLRKAGVDVRAALPVGVFRTFVGRTDLRLHRKIVLIDHRVVWTGSMNLVDPRFFKQDSGVGQWVDAMVRLEGPVVGALGATLVADWCLETEDSAAALVKELGLAKIQSRGQASMQVVSSGPGQSGDGMLQVILTLINSASSRLVLTTPYLVPDESLLRALRGAAARGCEVTLIVPEKVDSFLTRYASRSYFDDLLEVGVRIEQFRGGLLHTKSIVADGERALFGTVNLDMRSLWLNFEVALVVYDREFCEALTALHDEYRQAALPLDVTTWNQRRWTERFLENTLRLASPLL